MKMPRLLSACLLATVCLSQKGFAAVERVEVKTREPFYASRIGSYIRITGSFTGSLDPNEPIPNLSKAPRRDDGKIEYASNFTIIAPEQASAGNQVLLYDAENNGRPVTNSLYNSPIESVAALPDLGNGFLENEGFTIVTVDWQDKKGIRLPQYIGPDGASKPILPVGFAAIRDFIAFLRWETTDHAGAPNPIAGTIHWALAAGQSQSARMLKSYIYHRFNRIGERTVIDGFHIHVGQSGTMPYIPPPGISASTIDLTITGDSSVYPFTYQEILAPLAIRGEPPPKIIATNVEADYMRRRLSLVRTGTDSIKDAPIPNTVRLWDFAGASHGIVLKPEDQNCIMPRANLDWHPLTRAALVSLARWVKESVPPPPTKLLELEVTRQPAPYLLPAPTADYPKATLMVPKRNLDGNSEGGIRLPSVAVPLQTFGGWNAPLQNNCGDMSNFAYPFANSKLERLMKNDLRPSIEERYSGPADYAGKFEEATLALKKEGYLSDADAAALIERGRAASEAIAKNQEPH